MAAIIASGAVVAGCTVNGDINFNITDATVSFKTDVDVSHVMPGTAVPVNITTTNVILVDKAATPTPAQAPNAGYIQIYLDDETAPPLLVTAEVKVDVKIAIETKPGPHKLRCHVFKHDGTPTKAVFEISITVVVSTSTPDMAVLPGG